MDEPYERANVDEQFWPIFEQLKQEFGSPYEVWVRKEDFGLSIEAAVVDRAAGIPAKIPLMTKTMTRTTLLTPSEIQALRTQLQHRAKGAR